MVKDELLKKLKTLAERGERGERDTASIMLRKIMDKYGITEDELDDEKVEMHWFGFKDKLDEKLLFQILYMVLGGEAVYTNGIKKIGVDCTVSQAVEIESFYSFYKVKLKEDLEVCYHAFVMKNNLYPQNGKTLDIKNLSAKEIEDFYKAQKMAMGMQRHEYHKQIAYNRV